MCHMVISASSTMSFHTGEDECVGFGSVVGLCLIEVEVKVVGVVELTKQDEDPVNDGFQLNNFYKWHLSCKLNITPVIR
jgi:hypothetical protein